MRRAALAVFAALLAAPGPAIAATVTLDAGVATYTGGSTGERLELRYDAVAGTVAFAEPLGTVTPPPAGC
jgi:hypothetical protein